MTSWSLTGVAMALLGSLAWGAGPQSAEGAPAPPGPPTPTITMAPLPPAPPATAATPDPIEAFRALLSLAPAAREKAIASRSASQQEYLRARFKEFDALPAAEREVRLQLMQLRYHLGALMRLDPSNRVARLQQIPPLDLPLIEQRLRAWDQLPRDEQQELLQHEGTLRLFPTATSEIEPPASSTLDGYSAGRRQQLEADLERWRTLPEAQRHRVARHFNTFFSLSERQQALILERLDADARHQLKPALAALERLAPEERLRCLDAFDRFTRMSAAEQQRFLRNAARWQGMKPEERRAWRAFAARWVPPSQPPPIPPPMPAAPRSRLPTPTNAQAAR
ncbi:MAG TPA: DUF3106 domain-containing protein [Verrucomicrobiota bacterium]|nr:DUF3106 domain-containing protein [Verrucomicrobiota bacterium]HNU52075.1 DUF3106 domain-containing protein [Verrucomicrobiota bacterium]